MVGTAIFLETEVAALPAAQIERIDGGVSATPR